MHNRNHCIQRAQAWRAFSEVLILPAKTRQPELKPRLFAKCGIPVIDVPTVPDQPAEKTNDELLLELGKLVTLDHLDKELDVENKLQAKTDRLFKRLYQIKAMKSLAGSPLAPGLAGTTPVLELSATDA